jgi:hypothetical protein
MNKYNNKKVMKNGLKFDSRKEYDRYYELSMLEKAGVITDLILQPKYLLQKAYKYKDETIRAIHYIADFSYMLKGKLIIEDVKGYKTDIYKLKLKLFLKTIKDNDNIIFKEII